MIGGVLVRRLADDGVRVRAVDAKRLGDWLVRADEYADVWVGDLRDPTVCEAVVPACDTVYHLAADMGGMGFIASNRTACLLSAAATANVLRASLNAGVDRFFYASSACVYPEWSVATVDAVALREEDAYPAGPADDYGWEKLMGERLCAAARAEHGIAATVARFDTVYGAPCTFTGGREKVPAALCRKVADAALRGAETIEVWGDGQQTRALCHVSDCVDGIVRIVDADPDGPVNLGGDQLVTVDDLAAMVEGIAGVRLGHVHDLDQPQGARGRLLDTGRLRALGWEPRVSTAAGMEETYRWVHDRVAEAVTARSRGGGVSGLRLPRGVTVAQPDLDGSCGLLAASGAPVAWVTLHAPDIKGRAYWDEGWLEEMLADEGWPTGLPSFRHVDHPREMGAPGVVVIPARWHAEDADELADAIPSGSVVVLCGDEEGAFPRRDLPQEAVWLQTPWPHRALPGDRFVGDGVPPECRPILAANGQPATPRGWFYSGQLNNPRRLEAYETLRDRRDARGDGALRVTKMFGGGYDYGTYLSMLADARVVPCPGGSFTPDTFRLYETMEAGGVPVADRGTDKAPPDYWTFLFGEDPPFPIVDRWADFGAVYEAVDASWPADANRIGAWWVNQKRRLARRFAADVASLAPMPDRGADGRVTVLIPFSPIPTHPDLAILAETIASVRERLPTADVIVMVDGVRPEQEHRRADYAEATRRLIWRANHDPGWRGVLPLVFDTHLHQAGMTRAALAHVHTEAVLFVEQDTPLIGDVPFAALLAALDTGEVNLIRLSHEAAILEPHRHLMLDDQPVNVAGVPLIRTVQWSQRPHLATVDFYRRVVTEFFGADARSFIEDVMHGVVDGRWRRHGLGGWEQFRLAVYAPPGNIKRSTHLDGRAGEEKYPQTWAYDGPTPEDAPTPRVTMATVPEPVRPRRRRAYRLGIFGARADRRGLATQTTEAARHLHPERVFGIDMKHLSPYLPDWKDYDLATLTVAAHDEVTHATVGAWVDGLDVVFGCETFYVPWFTSLCASRGVRTVLQPNPEFVGHVLDWQPHPDVIGVPSTWRIDTIPGAVHLPVGVDRVRLPYRHRARADTFLMIVGHQAVHDRQGLRVVLAALRHVTRPVRVVVRSQRPLANPGGYGRHVTLDVRVGDEEDYWRLYDEGDVMLHPRRYGGLSLPAQEALSCGMPVLMPDAPPQDGFLPDGMLLPCTTGQNFRSLVGDLPLYDVNPRVLAARMDALVDDPGEVSILSKQADGIAVGLDWANLADRYDDLFADLTDGKP